MKKITHYILKEQKAIACIIILLAACTIGHAQPPDIGGDVDGNVPLDGGLSLLLAAGVGYGAKKLGRKNGR